ncbi:centrosomal protein of 290 kDa-like [Trichoplusia ni]|uniref:Centrosomal protein of 290 kDa-like n=1 Tax=Trichoplusia ni TaxID=7111 RepID=A0A7E5W8G0_TRINI|nr:centrosomal protein of 290 kDa-like [Trichoplusia ni]
MVETDWREILSFSQKELTQSDKEKLCESLCWMEADDIELNFTDLKTLFRLAQDILKLKSEQVNNIVGQLKATQKKSGKMKVESSYAVSPTQSNDSALETITHQEEIIKANKEILEQLYADIADLESKKSKLEESRSNFDAESDSSRDVLSEMNAVAELEQQVSMKNKHIRKLLSDVKILEDENTKLKDKVSVLKDKLTEATQLIDNLTEQLLNINNECSHLKDLLGKSAQAKSQLSIEIEGLRKELFEKESNRENIYEDIKSKVAHWKNIARSKKAELEALSNENLQLKENLKEAMKVSPSPKKGEAEKQKIKELQDKLLEASNEIEQTANLINVLRAENKQLKSIIDEVPESVSEARNVSDDGKERTIINKLKKKVKNLTVSLQGAEEMIGVREKELTEITSQLQLLQSDEGISALLEGLKNKKRQLRFKDEGIKNLVQETNSLNQLINDLQLENETLRQKLSLPPDEKVPTKGIMKEYRNLQEINSQIKEELNRQENKIVSLELSNRNLNSKIQKMTKVLKKLGYSKDKVDGILQDSESDDCLPLENEEEQPKNSETQQEPRPQEESALVVANTQNDDKDMIAIVEENKGLRKGLQEILDFLKDNSTTSSGVLTLQCPSLEAILLSMEARNSAGWFAPHMSTVMELRAALGGKDALLTALHDARKETFEVMTQLSDATKKSSELEKKLNEIVLQNQQKEAEEKELQQKNASICEFGSWMSDKEQIDIDFFDKSQIDKLVERGNFLYECQLKKGLEYFHMKFKELFDKLTSMAIRASDDLNKWSIQEENYKAEIERLKSQIQVDDEEYSECSPGIIPIPNFSFLQRKCSYLEESYKYIRTLNENMKNEILENKRAAMIAASEYETQYHKMLLSVANLTDKLRHSISLELFLKQNLVLNEAILKYRKLVEDGINNQQSAVSLLDRLDEDKVNIINCFRLEFHQKNGNKNTSKEIAESNIEQMILKKQIQQICEELDVKNKKIETLEKHNAELQEAQMKIIDENLASITKQEVDLMKSQLSKLTEDNRMLKEQCQHVSNQLDIALLQLQDSQQRQMSNDMEINMLQHQVLDLQSASDNKAIIARLSGEILVAHLQVSESQKRIERLQASLNKERELKREAEEMLRARQNIFDVYSMRYESKFRYMYEVMQTLRQQYQGSTPLISVEKYLNNIEEVSRKNKAVDEKLAEIEDLQSSLMTKHTVFDQVLNVTKDKCLIEEDSCPHKLKYMMMQSVNSRELDHVNKKLRTIEQSREDLLKHCNYLEKTLVLVNQGFEKYSVNDLHRVNSKDLDDQHIHMELEDVQSDDDSTPRRSETVTLSKPQVLKQPNENSPQKSVTKETVESPVKMQITKKSLELIDANMQTDIIEVDQTSRSIQTIENSDAIDDMKKRIEALTNEIDKTSNQLYEAMTLAQRRTEEILVLNREKICFESTIQNLKDSNDQKDILNDKLRCTIDELRKQLNDVKTQRLVETNQVKDSIDEENKSLLLALKQLENDKNAIMVECKELLNNERDEYAKNVKELQLKIMELQSKLDRRSSETNSSNGEAVKEVVTKYTMKIAELEDKCFRLQSELDECKSGLTNYQSEAERWKDLASERLTKMEQLNSQLEERHCHEVKSYKAENEHWLSQLNDMQREHMDLRTRITEQKTIYLKQLSDKDHQIEQLRMIINNLKTQIMNMQTLISVNDPSFDLSAIVEVDETSDAMSQHGSERLELKFESTMDLHDSHDDVVRIPASSTTIWQEPVIERLRREKQLAGKQNAILRRQIKVLASRERRARLDAQNLKNQIFRISTTGNKVTTAETAALHNKIASLQAQLTSARRETHSSIALWDKWKRAQQSADRWQSRYDEKSQEVTKLEAGLSLVKSAMSRLEKEKRMLLTRLNEMKNDNQLVAIEKQESESQEKLSRSACACGGGGGAALPVSARALLERVAAQQRRIAALEVAEKGNELLVSEYEKSLAEITSLKGQVLKLESTLLESQIRIPLKSAGDSQPELDYWKSYCEMLKEENVQLTHKINSLETSPITAHQHKVNDLEQTVLTLRGVINRLQAENKAAAAYKRVDSRPNSSRSGTDKSRTNLESHRIEILNLKRTIHEKDLLLERSKEMLKIAAEREDELLRENAYLTRQLNEMTRSKGGFMSA